MSSTRQEAMATIAQAINTQTPLIKKSEPASVIQPHAAPGVLPDEETTQEGQEGQEQEQEQEAASPVSRATNTAANHTRAAINYGKMKVASVPSPGGLLFPIGVLFIFFLLLLPVNGNTRVQWLWLVITGNAQLSGEGGSQDQTGVVPPDKTPQTGGPGGGQSVATVPFNPPQTLIGGPPGVNYLEAFTGGGEIV